MRLILTIEGGPAAGRQVVVTPDRPFYVGRTETAYLAVPEDGQLATAHFVLECIKQVWYVRDLGTRAGTIAAPMDVPAVVVIVAAHNEADRIEQTLAALGDAFPGARVLVADDASTDATAARAAAAGAEVVTAPRNIGKGGANTLAARRVLSLALTPEPPIFVLLQPTEMATQAE